MIEVELDMQVVGADRLDRVRRLGERVEIEARDVAVVDRLDHHRDALRLAAAVARRRLA